MKRGMTARVVIVGCHAFFGGACIVRPDLDLILRGYQPFGPLAPWGFAMLTLAVVLFLARPGGLLLMLSSLASSTVFFAVSTLLTSGVGLVPTGATLTWLGVASLMLFGQAFEAWLQERVMFHAFVKRLKRRWSAREP